jgi:RimJ/RimL family protein N-acetyltransferase
VELVMMQTTVCSERLLLCPATGNDLPALLALWRKTGVCRYLFDGDAPTRDQAAHYRSAQLGVWLLRRPANHELLGCATLNRAARAALEVRIALHPQHQGHGFAQEALAALMAHATQALGATQFVAHCCVPDAAGDRLLRCLGFAAGYECDGGRYRVRQYRRERWLQAPLVSPWARSAALPGRRLAAV